MSELESILRRVLDEALTDKLQPINERLDHLQQGQVTIIKRLDTLEERQTALEQRQTALEQRQVALEQRQTALEQRQVALEQRQVALEQGQRKLQKDISEIKLQIKGIWEDIIRLDNRLIHQEKITGSR